MSPCSICRGPCEIQFSASKMLSEKEKNSSYWTARSSAFILQKLKVAEVAFIPMCLLSCSIHTIGWTPLTNSFSKLSPLHRVTVFIRLYELFAYQSIIGRSNEGCFNNRSHFFSCSPVQCSWSPVGVFFKPWNIMTSEMNDCYSGESIHMLFCVVDNTYDEVSEAPYLYWHSNYLLFYYSNLPVIFFSYLDRNGPRDPEGWGH